MSLSLEALGFEPNRKCCQVPVKAARSLGMGKQASPGLPIPSKLEARLALTLVSLAR